MQPATGSPPHALPGASGPPVEAPGPPAPPAPAATHTSAWTASPGSAPFRQAANPSLALHSHTPAPAMEDAASTAGAPPLKPFNLAPAGSLGLLHLPAAAPPAALVTGSSSTSQPGPPYTPSAAHSVCLPVTSPAVVRVGDLTIEQTPMDSDSPPPRIRTYANYNLITAVCLAIIGWIFTAGNVKLVHYAISTNQLYYLVGLLISPVTVVFVLFPTIVCVIAVLVQLVGPIAAVTTNNQRYSALRTPPPRGAALPPVVVMIPVYKEDLDEVIRPTYESVQVAVDHYTALGGTAWWLVCDDGYMLLDRSKSMKRLEFYAKHNMTFVARPPHTEEKPRRGLFKKASNMNYTLRVNDLVKERLAEDENLTPVQAMAEVWEEHDKEFRAGGEGVCIPDDALVLLIDADTRVPPTCIYDTVGEFMVCPEVAYTQHYTTPFADQNHNYYECLMTFFTKTIYFNGFVMPCSLGACAPLVGHNAFLRYSSIKAAGFTCPVEGFTKYWSEDTVSEDFDFFMRLAQKDMWGRLVAYTGEEFREGVSLTYQDELIKFRKFAYGCCEMMFNRFKDWPRRGPITPMFWGFLTSRNIPWTQKVHMVGYLGTYLAMASAFYSTVCEAVFSVILPAFFDHVGTRSFDVNLTCFFVFGVIGTMCNILFRLRMQHVSTKMIGHTHTFASIVVEGIMYIPLLTLFFGSMLFHLTTACFCYFFNLKLDWGSTVKERQGGTSTWRALKGTVQAYWDMYLVMSIALGVYFAASFYWQVDMYRGWGLHSYAIMHMLGPILLNPDITMTGYSLAKTDY